MFRYLREIGIFLHCLTVFAVVVPQVRSQEPITEYEVCAHLVVAKHPAAMAVPPRPRAAALALDRSTI